MRGGSHGESCGKDSALMAVARNTGRRQREQEQPSNSIACIHSYFDELVPPAAESEKNIGPERLVAGLDCEDVVRGFDRLVKIPLENRLQLQFEAGLLDGLPVMLPHEWFT